MAPRATATPTTSPPVSDELHDCLARFQEVIMSENGNNTDILINFSSTEMLSVKVSKKILI